MAFWGCCAAIFFNTLLHIPIVLSEGLGFNVVSEYWLYCVLLGFIAWSARTNWNFETVVSVCAALIFLHMWWSSFYHASIGNGSIFSLPVMMFTPIWLVITYSYRALILYSVVQALLVYNYTKFFAPSVYQVTPTPLQLESYSFMLAVLSATMVTVLAVMTYARNKTDERLLALIKETERLAAEDPLTGLKNRRAFMQNVEQLWDSKASFAIVFFDLDRFKPLNDEYGHVAGDIVLQTVGKRLKAPAYVLTAARFGGDEFAAIISEQMSDEALNTQIETLQKDLTQPVDIGVTEVAVGASAGYARAVYDGFSVSDVLHAADTAMMRSKNTGGTVEKFDPDKDDIRLSTSALAEAFKNALDGDEIKPALQPILDAQTRAVVGYELLSRWVQSGLPRDPEPTEFVPIAEKLGLLNQLLWHTMDLALPFLRDSQHFLAINVSPSQLSSTVFLDGLVAITEQHDFDLDRIEIEITESVAFRNLEDNIQTLDIARRMGCRVALDDFGSGYSSLSLLEELPLDKIKLDLSLQSTEHKRGVLQAAIRLADDLGFDCCVEGIETAKAANNAARMGCDQIQGYWVGQPQIITPNMHRLYIVS
ncbi:MAG: EAL domain-containing protein [Pseudomonadota bacterium]